MSRKKWITLIAVVAAVMLAGGALVFCLKGRADNAVASFDVSQYAEITQKYGVINADYVASAAQAKAVASAVWSSVYGNGTKGLRPAKVSFDQANKVWLVEGSKSGGSGIPRILIRQADCKILAVWFDK